MSLNVKVISTLNDKNAHVFLMFCDLYVTRMVRFRLKSFSCFVDMYSYNEGSPIYTRYLTVDPLDPTHIYAGGM